MAESVNQSLSRAYEHIESERLSEARAILEPIIANNKDNIEAWWLYAHAVEDKDEAREALNNVLRLDPNYPDANELLLQLSESSSQASTPLESAPFDLDELFGEDDEEDDGEDDFDDLDDDFDLGDDFDDDEISTPLTRRQILLRLLITALVIALILVIFVVINPFGEDEVTPSPTAPAAVAQETSPPGSQAAEPTEIPSIVNTEEAATTEEMPISSVSPYSSILAELDDLPVVEDGIAVTSTTLGETLLIPICSAPGSQARDTLNTAMIGLAGITDAEGTFGDDITAFGVELVDCANNNATLNVIAVSLSDAEAYAQGLLAEDAFRSRWRATN